jgi:hypothetical protein
VKEDRPTPSWRQLLALLVLLGAMAGVGVLLWAVLAWWDLPPVPEIDR